MMATIPEAIASLTGIPKKTKMGIRMLAPPRPVSAPRKPITMDMRSRENMSNKGTISKKEQNTTKE
jgi:hypothetical protein